jgi:hypothetical protein
MKMDCKNLQSWLSERGTADEEQSSGAHEHAGRCIGRADLLANDDLL